MELVTALSSPPASRRDCLHWKVADSLRPAGVLLVEVPHGVVVVEEEVGELPSAQSIHKHVNVPNHLILRILLNLIFGTTYHVVMAHVVSPINFLKACYNAMDEHTKLYVQTSQCDMHTKAQFDTSYHEHISFFTAHSFQYAAKLSRLKIVNYEKTPIHGTSCLDDERENKERGSIWL